MQLTLDWPWPAGLAFMLVFLRMSGFFTIFPLFSRPYCPITVQIFLALLTAAMLGPGLIMDAVPLLAGRLEMLQFALLAVREITLGVALGFSAYVIIVVGQMAGQFLDYQMGFFTASEIDPQFGTNIPLMGNYLYLFTLIIFVGVNGHHHLLRILRESFTHAPLGAPFTPQALSPMFELVSWMFSAAIQLSLPVLGCLFATAVAMGVLARTMPQLNIFVLGIPLRILMGFVILLAGVPVYGAFLRGQTIDQLDQLMRILRAW